MEETMTSGVDLAEVVADLKNKVEGEAGRAAHTLFGGRDRRLRQTVVYMLAGQEMAEHESPGDAALHVLRGRVRLRWGDASADLAAGQVMHIPPQRHSLEAVEESAVILTVALHNDWSGQG